MIGLVISITTWHRPVGLRQCSASSRPSRQLVIARQWRRRTDTALRLCTSSLSAAPAAAAAIAVGFRSSCPRRVATERAVLSALAIMLERVQRAWDRLHHRPLLYRRVGGGGGVNDSDDVSPQEEEDLGEMSEDWQPMMTSSLYCPGHDGELPPNCRRHRRSSTEAAKSGGVDDDGGDWCSLTLGRATRRCRCAALAATDKATAVGDHPVSTDDGLTSTSAGVRLETLPRFKSPVLGRRLRALVADEPSAASAAAGHVGSGSSSCPGSPRDVTRLSAAVGRRLQSGLSPRLSCRPRTDVAASVSGHQPRQDFAACFR